MAPHGLMELTTIAQSYLRFLRDKLNYCEIAAQIFQLQVWCKFVPFMTFFMQLMLTKMLEVIERFPREITFLKTGYPVSTQSIPTQNIRPPCSFLMFSGVIEMYYLEQIGKIKSIRVKNCVYPEQKNIFKAKNDRLYQYRSNIFFLILRQ